MRGQLYVAAILLWGRAIAARAQAPAAVHTTMRYRADTLWIAGPGADSASVRREVFRRDTLFVVWMHADTALRLQTFVFARDSIWLIGRGLLTGRDTIVPSASRALWQAHETSLRIQRLQLPP